MLENPGPRVGEATLDRGPEGAFQIYDEPTFLHFLAVEKKRAERSGRTVLLLLVYLTESEGPSRISRSDAGEVVAALTGAVREMDFVGWYRPERVIGAVLLQPAGGPSPDTITTLTARLDGVMRQSLTAALARQIRVRVVHVCPAVEG